jgi:hypothetical protein
MLLVVFVVGMVNSLFLYIIVWGLWFEEMSDELVLKIIKHEEEDDIVDEKALKDFDQYLHHFRVSKHSKEKKILDIQNSSNGSGGNMIRRTHTNDETIRYYDSDSPITMDSSDDDGGGGSENDFGIGVSNTPMVHPHRRNAMNNHSLLNTPLKKDESEKKKYKKLSYEKVKNTLDSLNQSDKYSSDIDILITFLKGQVHLYSLSKSLTQQKINWLTIPSFLFSIVITILSPLIHDYEWSGILISALTAFITSAIGCVRFFELDASATTFLNLANQYNRMQTSLEMVSNSIMMNHVSHEMEKDSKKMEFLIVDKIRDIEQKITEIKENNTFFPPEEVKLLIPIISNINIFTFIKKIELLKKNFILKYKEIKNEMRFILNKWDESGGVGGESGYGEDIGGGWKEEEVRMNRKYLWKQKQKEYKREKKRMTYLYKQKTLIRKELFYYMTAYSYIDEIFTREITRANNIHNFCFYWTFYGYFFNTYDYVSCENPVVDNYLHFIFMNKRSDVVEIPNAIDKIFEECGDSDYGGDFERGFENDL